MSFSSSFLFFLLFCFILRSPRRWLYTRSRFAAGLSAFFFLVVSIFIQMVRLSNFLFDVELHRPFNSINEKERKKDFREKIGTTREKKKNDSTLNWPLNSAQMFNEDFLSCSRNCLRYTIAAVLRYIRTCTCVDTNIFFFFDSPSSTFSHIFD